LPTLKIERIGARAALKVRAAPTNVGVDAIAEDRAAPGRR
jgi:hypothetical protein